MGDRGARRANGAEALVSSDTPARRCRGDNLAECPTSRACAAGARVVCSDGLAARARCFCRWDRSWVAVRLVCLLAHVPRAKATRSEGQFHADRSHAGVAGRNHKRCYFDGCVCSTVEFVGQFRQRQYLRETLNDAESRHFNRFLRAPLAMDRYCHGDRLITAAHRLKDSWTDASLKLPVVSG